VQASAGDVQVQGEPVRMTYLEKFKEPLKGMQGGPMQGFSLRLKRRAWAAQLYELKLTWLEAERKRRAEWMEAKGSELLRQMHEHRIEVQFLLDAMSDDGGPGRMREALIAAAAEHEAALEALKEQVEVSCADTSRAPAIVYVLSCEEGKFYVGRCAYDRFERRMQEHMGDSPEKKAEWTRRYPVIGVIEQQPCWDPLDENLRVLKLMRERGVDNVRGGPWPMCDLGLWRNEIERQLSAASDKCFYCQSTSHFANECTHKKNAAGKPAAALQQLSVPPSPRARPSTPSTPPTSHYELCPPAPPLQRSPPNPVHHILELGQCGIHPKQGADTPTKKRPRCQLAERFQPELLAAQLSSFSIAQAPALHPSEAGLTQTTLPTSLATGNIPSTQHEHEGTQRQACPSPVQAPISRSCSMQLRAPGGSCMPAPHGSNNWNQQPHTVNSCPAMLGSCQLHTATAHPLQPASVPQHTPLPGHNACNNLLLDAGQAQSVPHHSANQLFSQSVSQSVSQLWPSAVQGRCATVSNIIAQDQFPPPESPSSDWYAHCIVQDIFDQDLVEDLGLHGAGKEAEQALPDGPQDGCQAGLGMLALNAASI